MDVVLPCRRSAAFLRERTKILTAKTIDIHLNLFIASASHEKKEKIFTWTP